MGSPPAIQRMISNKGPSESESESESESKTSLKVSLYSESLFIVSSALSRPYTVHSV